LKPARTTSRNAAPERRSLVAHFSTLDAKFLAQCGTSGRACAFCRCKIARDPLRPESLGPDHTRQDEVSCLWQRREALDAFWAIVLEWGASGYRNVAVVESEAEDKIESAMHAM